MAISLQFRSAFLITLFLACLICLAPSAGAETVDRLAAVVDEQLITLSDVRWFIEYRNQRIPEDSEERETFLRGILNQLINQRLIVKETAKTPFIQVNSEDVAQFAESYKRRFSTDQEYRSRLREMGMREYDLMSLFRRQLIVNKFIELRFEPFIIVLPSEIRDYYENEFLPEMGPDQTAPPLQLIEENIRQILTLRKTTQQLERWVENNLANSSVRILLFREVERSPNLPDSLVGKIEFSELSLSRTSSSNR